MYRVAKREFDDTFILPMVTRLLNGGWGFYEKAFQRPVTCLSSEKLKKPHHFTLKLHVRYYSILQHITAEITAQMQ